MFATPCYHISRMKPRRRHTLLIFSQTFVPDPAAVGQHVADVAIAMARRGHRVIVYASARGYEDPRQKYPRRENLQSVEVRRFPIASFGKSSIPLRIAGTFVFMLQCLIVGLFTRGVDGILFSTSPPLIGFIASIVHIVRDIPIAYWAMDLNPDQLIALQKISSNGLMAGILEDVNRFILRESALVIALDRFMAERLRSRVDLPGQLIVLPPWPHEEHIQAPLPEEKNSFRAQHHLDGKFVVMYSGNHSPSNPLTTILDAAVQLKDDPGIIFLFVGGGNGKRDVERIIRNHNAANIISLPYQPLEKLGQSLSAADVHIVALGEPMVGIIHPCKIYGAMTVGRPVVYLGPKPSHISDLLDSEPFGIHVAHGDVDGAVRAIRQLKEMSHLQLRELGNCGQRVLRERLSQQVLRDRLCGALELSLRLNN
jgi:putative colanic acid biosynthesis glycosyltransferase WcaI